MEVWDVPILIRYKYTEIEEIAGIQRFSGSQIKAWGEEAKLYVRELVGTHVRSFEHADPIRTVIEVSESDSDSDISATASNWSVH